MKTSLSSATSNDEESSELCLIQMTLDDTFKKAGEFGLFQKRFFVIITLVQVAVAFHTMAITFVGLDPEWQCSQQPSTNITLDNAQKCSLYNNKLQGSKHSPSCTPEYTDRFHSIAQEFDLICDQSYKTNLTQSWYFLGFLVGSYVLGYLADKIGRRKVVIGFLVLISIVQVLTALSVSYVMFTIGRFFVGFFVAGNVTMYVLACELVGAPQRSLLAVVTSGMFGMAYGCLSLAAFLFPHWRVITLLSAALTFVFVLLSKYIPESPRWLYITGRDYEARQALLEIASINGNTLPYQFTIRPPKKSSESNGLIDFFKHSKMRRRMLVQMLEWFTVCMVYYGLSLSVGNLSSNLYLAFTLSGLVEIPSNVIALFALEKLGRRWSNIGFLVIGGVASLACSYIQFTGGAEAEKLGLSLVGKFSVAATFTIIFAYTPELIPTDMRNFGMGVTNVCARFGGIIAPLVILLDSQTPGVSMLLMGGLCVITSVLCLYLPETLNISLPNTLAELIA